MTTALALDLGFDRPAMLGGSRDDDPAAGARRTIAPARAHASHAG